MLIKRSKIRNVASYLDALPKGTKFRVTAELDDRLVRRLHMMGFSEKPESGDTVLPRPYGPVSRFNAFGGWQLHRDLPKQDRFIRTVSWRWKQWSGRHESEEREEFRDIYRP
jgi:hypothetical protein